MNRSYRIPIYGEQWILMKLKAKEDELERETLGPGAQEEATLVVLEIGIRLWDIERKKGT